MEDPEKDILEVGDALGRLRWPRGVDVSGLTAPAHHKVRVIRVNDTKVYSRTVLDAYPNPTRMHIVLGRVARTYVSEKRVVDLGSGCGALGVAAATGNASYVAFADLRAESMRQGLASYMRTMALPDDWGLLARQLSWEDGPVLRHAELDRTLAFLVGDARSTVPPVEPDLLLCAPYFIPGVDEYFPQVYDTFAGIARQAGATLLIGHSSLVNREVSEAAATHGFFMHAVRDERQSSKVDFTVEYADKDPSHQRQLRTKTLEPSVLADLLGRGLERIERDGNAVYRHDIIVSELSIHNH